MSSPFDRHVAVLREVQYKDWTFSIVEEEGDAAYLKLHFVDPETGETHTTRGWRIERYMTISEITRTCLAAVLLAEEHEARERFLWRGRAVYGPHFNVERLWELHDRAPLDRRPDTREAT